MALREFKLPDPGEGLVEADIVTWRVAVGDTVKINDILVEIETSKSLVELPSPYAGTVAALLVAEGTTAEVGSPIIRIEDGTGAPSAPATPSAADPVEDARVREPLDGLVGDSSEARMPNLVGYGPRAGANRRRPRRSGGEPVPEPVHAQASSTFATDVLVSRHTDVQDPLRPAAPDAVPTPAPPLPAPGPAAPEPVLTGGPVLAKPPVRKLAKDLGVDLRALTGSGPGGIIVREDVTRAHDARTPAPSSPATSSPESVSSSTGPDAAGPDAGSPILSKGDVRVPIKGVRKATAEAMVRSAFTAPHVTEWLTCDVTATMELVARLKERREFRDVRVSPLLVVARAVCLALGRTPELNSFWDEPAGEIVLKSSVNLGIAAATPRGLVVPNVKDAQTLGLLGLAQALNALVTTARDGRTTPAEMSGGTFTITNVGTFGVDAGTPILNPGESGILCLGSIARRPWVVGTGDDEQIVPRWVTTLAVSFDHRLADGLQGSTFLADVAALLHDPALAMLY